jgi:hypothetical protein
MDNQKKAEELSIKYNCNVTPIVFRDEEKNEDIVGFIKEPSRVLKLRVMDKAMTGAVTAASELFDAIILKEESDKRFTSEESANDKYYLGGAMVAFKTVEFAVDTFKKK